MTTNPRHRPPQPAQTRSLSSAASLKPSHQPVTLAKRLLFPHLHTNDLPPLLLSDSAPPELTAELYDFIALALRAFVNPWWTKITRYDKEFLPDITRILTVVIHELERRVATVDLCPLLFQDIPSLVTQHYQDYRNASSKVTTSYSGAGAVSLPQLFHQLQPHMAVSPDGNIEPEYMRQVIDVILKACLPTEDFEPEAERYIIREVILKVVLQDVIPKITQPWFINKVVLDLLEPADGNNSVLSASETAPSPTRAAAPSHSSFSFHNIVIFVLSAIQSVSGFCLVLVQAYKQAMNTIKLVNQTPPRSRPPSPYLAPSKEAPYSSIPGASSVPSSSLAPSPIIQHSASNVPIRLHTPPISESSSTSSIYLPAVPNSLRQAHPQPDLPADEFARAPLLLLSEIFTTRQRFASSAIMTSTLMLSTSLTSFLDRLLPYMLNANLSFQFVTNIVRISKRTLFPNGYPAPAPPDPTAEEQAIMLQRLVSWRPKGALAHLIPLLLGPDPSPVIASALEPLSNTACNVHLIVLILDRIFLALFPELGGALDSSLNIRN
ncbi:hypothetical protein HGRIS_007664 [Hohenbuehelia grisea]|uniref:PXA domain-containing protein n=1 Tax=Hohenbuehelia grisea TaxID=104357 RepID=A0ABR3J6X9_9AGAR